MAYPYTHFAAHGNIQGWASMVGVLLFQWNGWFFILLKHQTKSTMCRAFMKSIHGVAMLFDGESHDPHHHCYQWIIVVLMYSAHENQQYCDDVLSDKKALERLIEQ